MAAHDDPTDESRTPGPETIVTPLTSMETQVGAHVIQALEQTETVAVITMVTGGRTGQQIISIPLDDHDMENVHALLQRLDGQDAPETDQCVGFHCEFPGSRTRTSTE